MNLWILYKREIGSYFLSTVAYVVMLASALSIGFYFSIMFNFLNQNDMREYTVLQACLMGFFFWLVITVQTPLITMRSFSEEFKMGTVEMLLTAPVREWEIVLAKYLAAFSFYLILWLPLLFDLFILHFVSNTHVPLFWRPTSVAFFGIACFGMFYTSIGIFTSVLTKNQIIAAILAFVLTFLSFSLGFISYLDVGTQAKSVLSYFSVIEQMENFSHGIFDSRPVFFYFTTTLFVLFLTQRILNSRRLKS